MDAIGCLVGYVCCAAACAAANSAIWAGAIAPYFLYLDALSDHRHRIPLTLWRHDALICICLMRLQVRHAGLVEGIRVGWLVPFHTSLHLNAHLQDAAFKNPEVQSSKYMFFILCSVGMLLFLLSYYPFLIVASQFYFLVYLDISWRCSFCCLCTCLSW